MRPDECRQTVIYERATFYRPMPQLRAVRGAV